MNDSTAIAARIVGPYSVIMGATLALRANVMALMLPAFMQDGPLVLAAGAFTTIAGLTLLAFHHSFRGLPAIVITVVAIAATVKGALLMLVPEFGAPFTAAVVRATPLLLALAIVMILIGLWLSFIGWSKRIESARQRA